MVVGKSSLTHSIIGNFHSKVRSPDSAILFLKASILQEFQSAIYDGYYMKVSQSTVVDAQKTRAPEAWRQRRQLVCCGFQKCFLSANMSIHRKKEDISKHLPREFHFSVQKLNSKLP